MVWSADEHSETASEKQGARPVNFCCGWCLWWWRWWCWWSLLKRWGTNYYASVLSDDAALMHTMHTHWAREMTTLKRWPCHQRKKKKGKERRKEEKVKCRLTAELSIMSSARRHWMSVLSLRLSLSMSLTTMGTTSTSTVHLSSFLLHPLNFSSTCVPSKMCTTIASLIYDVCLFSALEIFWVSAATTATTAGIVCLIEHSAAALVL